jgi:hypothetical protein
MHRYITRNSLIGKFGDLTVIDLLVSGRPWLAGSREAAQTRPECGSSPACRTNQGQGSRACSQALASPLDRPPRDEVKTTCALAMAKDALLTQARDATYPSDAEIWGVTMRILAFAAAGTLAWLGVSGVASASAAVLTRLPSSTGIAGCVAGGTAVSTDPCSFGGASAFTVGAHSRPPRRWPQPRRMSALAPIRLSPNYFTIDGPDNGSIAIGIATNLLTSADPDNTAFAGISTSQGTNACADTNEGLCGGAQFDGILIEMDEPGQVYFVHLEAVASVGIFGGSAFASADPFIFVEPTDPNADLYSIRLSDGIANGVAPPPGVPEPSTWAMLLLGFAGIAFAGCRGARDTRAS